MAASSDNTLESGLHALALVARYYGQAVDLPQLKHRFGYQSPTSPWSNLLRAAKFLTLKARHKIIPSARVAESPLPLLGLLKSGVFVVVGRVTQGKALVFAPDRGPPLVISLDELATEWTGEVVLFTRRPTAERRGRFNLGWFAPAIRRHRGVLAQVLLASLFIQLFALTTPLFFQVVIDKVLVHRGLTTLDVLAIGLLVISVFEVVLGGLRTYLFSHTTSRIDATLGAGLFEHLLALPMSYFESRRIGDTVARVRELETVRAFLTGSALTLVVDLVFTVVFVVVMHAYSPILTSVVLAVLPGYVLLSIGITPALRTRLQDKFSRGADNQAFLVESIAGIETLKGTAIEPLVQTRWEEQLAGYVGAGFKAANLSNIANQIASLLNKLTIVAILWLGAKLVIEGALSVGQLVAFNMLAARVSGPVLRLVQLWQDFQQTAIAITRLGDILNAPVEPSHNTGRASLPDLRGRVTLQAVSFRYRPDSAYVLENLNLEALPGEVVGIVGVSGSGKSTLAKLVQRIYLPSAGRLFVDGVDLVMVDPVWLRRSIGVVAQDSFLFNRSIRDNIALRDPASSLASVVHAAKLAGAHRFIVDLSEGYDTLIFEQGANLSGGQRQRLSLARALLTNPRILILDEATSALDYESERIIQSNMRAICEHRTVFIIAHRLSALNSATRIIVLDRGRIAEQGTHTDLLEQGGLYARMYAIQNDTRQKVL